ncbi:UNVERIFIED_ORG: hypothetical protein J2806_000917 [Kosakonia oryzae]|nr:hypothetical protein [Kosakonia oryzae]SKC01694.1 hypothetical protein SAMN05216168_0257 [Kosakonia radicincitans]VVT47734.1 hypothetical protein UYSO10_1666 [Kosakonia radicincitans]
MPEFLFLNGAGFWVRVMYLITHFHHFCLLPFCLKTWD